MNEKMKKRLADLKARQEKGEYRRCPRCGEQTMKPELYTNALSRLADIMICDVCGMDEAKLAFMRNPGTLYSWAALKPVRPACDFEKEKASSVLERILSEQQETLLTLFQRLNAGETDEAIRYDAFESCPGLSQMWTRPFQARYHCKDKDIHIAFRKTENGSEMTVSMI